MRHLVVFAVVVVVVLCAVTAVATGADVLCLRLQDLNTLFTRADGELVTMRRLVVVAAGVLLLCAVTAVAKGDNARTGKKTEQTSSTTRKATTKRKVDPGVRRAAH